MGSRVTRNSMDPHQWRQKLNTIDRVSAEDHQMIIGSQFKIIHSRILNLVLDT